MIAEALRLCDDEGALLDLLAAVGFRLSDAELYRDVRFLIAEERWYSVDADFPKLTKRGLVEAGVPVSALDVEYNIDLSGETPPPLTSDELSRAIEDLIQEAA